MDRLPAETLRPAESELKKHRLPRWNHGYDALEPCIDARTMMIHHGIHHRAYVDQLNTALEKFPHLRNASALWLLCNLVKVPREIRTPVHRNAGGHVNHSMFWRAMKPGAAGEPGGPLREAIDRDFGSLAKFKTRFEEAGTRLFGSGWVWLARTRREGGTLDVLTTSGHDHPMMRNRFPILLNDVWEHAYYLRYQNRRADYLKAWWSVVDWAEAARLFDLSDNAPEELWEAEGGATLAPSE